MADQTLSVNYTHPSVTSDDDDSGVGNLSGNWWIRLEQEKLDEDNLPDRATMEETAVFIDTIYELEACDGSDSETLFSAQRGGDQAPEEEPMTQEEFADLVDEQLEVPTCETIEEGYRVVLNVYRSNTSFPYELDLSHGEVESTEVFSGEVEEFALFENQSQFSLSKPVDGGVTIEQLTTFVSDEGVVEDIEFTTLGSTINTEQRVTGSIKVTYQSTYDVVTIFLGMEEIEDVSVRAFYHGLVTDIILHPAILDDLDLDACLNGFSRRTRSRVLNPDDSCYQRVYKEYLCQCSKTVSRTDDEWVPTSCKDGDPTGTRYSLTENDYAYVDCDETDALNSESYYLNTCCKEVPGDKELPECKDWYEIFVGGRPIDRGKEYWQAIYGEDTAFIGLGPETQFNCGDTHHQWNVVPKNCCGPGIPAMTWTETQSSLEIDQTYRFCFSGGVEPFSWDLPVGLEMVSQGANQAGDACANIKVNSCFCYGTIVVTDYCSNTLYLDVSSTGGSWVVISHGENPLYSSGPHVADGNPVMPVGNAGYEVYVTNFPYRLFVKGGLDVANAGTSAYTLCDGGDPGLPYASCNFDWRCWGYHYVNSGTSYGEFINYWANPQTEAGLSPIEIEFSDPYGAVGVNWSISSKETGICTSEGGDNAIVARTYDFTTISIVSYKWECPDIEELVYDDENSPDTIADDSLILVFWEGGTPPFTVTTIGDNFFVDNNRSSQQITTNGRSKYLYSGDVCGTLEVKIVDKCGQEITGTVVSTTGNWVLQGNTSTCLLTEDDAEPTYYGSVGASKVWLIEDGGIKQEERTVLSHISGETQFTVDGCPDANCNADGCVATLPFISDAYNDWGWSCLNDFINSYPAYGYGGNFPVECSKPFYWVCYCGYIALRRYWTWEC